MYVSCRSRALNANSHAFELLQRFTHNEQPINSITHLTTRGEIDEIAVITDLPTEIYLHIFEAITDLNDLINFLGSSEQLREICTTHMRGSLRTIIVPRICPGNTAAVEEMLQTRRYVYEVPQPDRTVQSVSTSSDDFDLEDFEDEWQLAGSHDVWDSHSGYPWNPTSVLWHLKTIIADAEALLRLIQDDKGMHHERIQKAGTDLLRELLWDVQANTLRCACIQAIELRGDRPRSLNTIHQALRHVAREFYDGLSLDKQILLPWVVGIAEEVDRHLRRHLLTLPSDGMLFRIAYGPRLNDLRLTFTSPLHRLVAQAISENDGSDPVCTEDRDRTAYERLVRAARNNFEADDSVRGEHLQAADRRTLGRVGRIRASLSCYLETLHPIQTLKPAHRLAQIGRFYDQWVGQMQGNGVLERHFRTVAIYNGYGEKPVQIDDILPDMTACLKTAVKEWAETRKWQVWL